jgi:hypothetical protein
MHFHILAFSSALIVRASVESVYAGHMLYVCLQRWLLSRAA